MNALRQAADALNTRRGYATMCALLCGAGLFYGFQWSWLRQAVLAALEWSLQRCGLRVAVDGFTLIANGLSFPITRDCTYMEWYIYAIPLLWREGSAWLNCGRVAAILAGAFFLNLVRIHFAIVWHVAGVPWFWAHDFVDYFTWYGTMTMLAILWLHWLTRWNVRQAGREQTQNSPVH